MKYTPLFLEYLVRYQARLNLGLLILLGLALPCSTLAG
ncbi:hypothetical protein P308_16820 [Pseudomonas piscis]|nr:hypothetical protein P308_16820 [Pseudomonas piscis]